MTLENPILNSTYEEPLLHYNTDSEGNLDYSKICNGRRIFKPDKAVLPTVHSIKYKYNYPEWHFIEITNDIRNIKNQLIEKINSIYGKS